MIINIILENMMRYYKFLLSVFCIILNIPDNRAQEITFNHLTTNDGLSHNSVMAIYQDDKGFMWLGTRNGVSLYNGKEFTIYKFRKKDPNSLIYNNISAITGNGDDEIYIMTAKGVSKLQISDNKISTLIQGCARSIFYHKQLYISIENNIYRYDGKQFRDYYRLKDSKVIISSIYICDDFMLIGTKEHGLYRLGLQDNQLSSIIPQGQVIRIFKDSTGKFWIGTSENGVYLLNGDSITNFQNIDNNPFSISSNFIRDFCEDKQGNIWIGSSNGLNKYNATSRTFSRYQKQNKENGLTHTSIWSLLCDHQGTVWIGTYFGGINYFNPDNQIYNHYQISDQEEEGLSSSIIGCITEDSQNNLWISTEGGGLNKYNPKTGKFKWYKHHNHPNSLSHNNIKALYYDKVKEILWIGTHMGGLNKLETRNGHITRYSTKNNPSESIHSNTVRDIVPYKDKLILATHGGISVFDPSNGKCQLLFKDQSNSIQFVTSVCIDHRGTLWIGGNGDGVYSYNFDTQELQNYKHNHSLKNSISSNNINRIYEDSQKRLWFCTNESGIDLYRYTTDDFENFDEQHHGLESNFIYDVCELSAERLLFITDSGFSIMDYPTRKISNYNQENGMPLSALNERSVYKSADGKIYIGGIDGMISFKEKDINYTPQSYSVHPFRLLVNGKAIEVNDESKVLSKTLTDTRKITLTSTQSMFSIEYANTNYIPFNKDEIEYYLEGFSRDWTNMRDQYSVTYTNLNPGKYTLIVRAKNNSLVPENKLEIEILPPFYRTGWAYLLYILCIGGILYYFFRTYHKRIKLQEALKYEKKHADDIEKLNQVKLRFFTNISHEFRTPLTLIIGQIEMLLQKRSFIPTIYNQILGIYKSSLQMRELIAELLDFRKQEQGYMTIKVREHNLVDFAYENYLLFQEYAAQRRIIFKFHKSNDIIPVWYDAKQMQKVINNLLSNAFKHVQDGGAISISIRKRNQEALIEVTDNGTGIDSKDINRIFDRFYQTEQMGNSSSYMGTGIGLSLSKGIVELHHGTIEVYSEPNVETSFIVHLKTGNEHFESEQICRQPEEMVYTTQEEYTSAGLLLNEQESGNIPDDATIKENLKVKILIIEDNEELRHMLVKIFEPFYHVISASNGEEGWEKIKSEHPNIVLSDIVMPLMSGTELCKRIKEDIDTCHIPVVLLTARTAVEQNLEGLQLGADDYITKPFNTNILLSRCHNLVNNRILLQEKFSKLPQAVPQMLATNPLDKKFMDDALTVIEKYMDNPEFNVDIFAREVGIARTKLFTKLKDITGQTPYEFIIMVRLKRAAIMLKEHPEMNISEIGDCTGFTSPRQFSRYFKEKYHLTPQAYRKTDVSDEKEDTGICIKE